MKKALLFLLIPIFSYAQCWKDVSNGFGIATNGTMWYLNNDNFFEVLNTVTLVNSSTDWATLSCIGRKLALKNNGTMWARETNGFTPIGSETWIAIASNGTFSAAIKDDGTLWTWGNNDVGQLGNGTFDSATSPQQVGTDNDWKSVTAGAKFGCAIKTNGTMWFWGQSIGIVSPNINQPMQIGSDSNWKSVEAGRVHAVAIKTDGSIWTWGYGSDGCLGLGTISAVDRPTRVGTDNDWAATSAWGVSGRASGGNATFSFASTFATKTNGTLWCWGRVGCSGYPFGSGNNSFSVPSLIYPEIENVVAIDAAQKYALQADGTLWRLGARDSWQETAIVSCEALSVQQIQSSVRFSVFPNPAADVLHITNPNNDPIKNITIYDLTGKTIFQTNNTSEIDVSTMQAGIYLLQAETDQKIHQAKFIKE